MINTMFMGISNFLISLFRAFPNASLSLLDAINTYGTDLNFLITKADLFFPVDTMFLIFGLIFVIETTLFTFKSTVFIYRMIPFIH